MRIFSDEFRSSRVHKSFHSSAVSETILIHQAQVNHEFLQS